MLRYLLAMTLGTLLLLGGVFYAWPADARPPDSAILVENDRFEPVAINIDGRDMGEVRAESRRNIPVSPGAHSVRIRDRAGKVVLAESVRVRPHGTTQLLVPANEAKLTVRNATGREGRLFVAGVDRGMLAPGAQRSMDLAPGTVRAELREGSRVLDTARLTVRAGERPTWRAEAPALAELRVRNPLPVAVRVRVATRPSITLEPGERQTFRDLPPGVTQLVVTERNGHVIAREEVRVDAFDGASFVVPPPSEGAVRLVNLGSSAVEVYVDGRRIASVGSRDEREIFVPLGQVELTLRDRQRDRVIRTTVDVQAFEEVTLRCDLARHYVTQEHRLVAELEELLAALQRLAS